eukprot:TRINITY_DN4267_c0_g2_i1.p1 TRINITY_DN4267_c0_g2~~TRINITY_DN4267_c0_g2_i1.p1  ORF type:complete len:301 (+),score=50.28 TRINITY_DN4267_c0_g2_i1:109-1011(+)
MGSFQKIGLIGMGSMGSAIAHTLKSHGVSVFSCLEGRSLHTRNVASKVGIIEVPDLKTLVQSSDLILSVIPPSEALSVAKSVVSTFKRDQIKSQTLYADLNAVSPMTIKEISALFQEVGISVVDGCILGPPPQPDKTTRFHFSGERAAELQELKNYGLEVNILAGGIGEASSLKMCFAGTGKAITALLTQNVSLSKSLGIYDSYLQEIKTFYPYLDAMINRSLPDMCPKAYRWIGEMEEIASTLSSEGFQPTMLLGAKEIYEMVAKSELGESVDGERKKPESAEKVATVLSQYVKEQKKG